MSWSSKSETTGFIRSVCLQIHAYRTTAQHREMYNYPSTFYHHYYEGD